MDLQNAINHARLARAINAEKRDVPANAALVALLAEVERLKGEKNLLADELAKYHGSNVSQVKRWLADKMKEDE